MKPKCISVKGISFCSTKTGSGCGVCVPLGKSGVCISKCQK